MKTEHALRIPFQWRERRSIVLERFLYIPQHYDRHAEWAVLPWSDPQIFGNDLPVCIEYCSGNGQWIGERAKAFPDRNWVAVEKKFERARKIWARMQREKLSNLFVVCGEGRLFTRHYAPLLSASELFVNFPDPWPKRRHAKNRLVSLEFLQDLALLAEEGAQATFVTDNPHHAVQMIKELDQCPLWKPLLSAPYFVHEWENYGHSFFSQLWQSQGNKIHYLSYAKNSTAS